MLGQAARTLPPVDQQLNVIELLPDVAAVYIALVPLAAVTVKRWTPSRVPVCFVTLKKSFASRR